MNPIIFCEVLYSNIISTALPFILNATLHRVSNLNFVHNVGSVHHCLREFLRNESMTYLTNKIKNIGESGSSNEGQYL